MSATDRGVNTYLRPDGDDSPTVSFSGEDLKALTVTVGESPPIASRDTVTGTLTLESPMPEWLCRLFRGEASDG